MRIEVGGKRLEVGGKRREGENTLKAFPHARSLRSLESAENAEENVFAGMLRMIHSSKPAHPAGEIYFCPGGA